MTMTSVFSSFAGGAPALGFGVKFSNHPYSVLCVGSAAHRRFRFSCTGGHAR